MKAYLPKSFQREANSDGVSDEDCQEAIRKAERGLIDADLGKGLIKQRISRGNQGAARGSRAVVFYRRGKVAVFLHIFPKSKKANLTESELAMYSQAAQEFAKLTNKELTILSAKRGWRELEI
jgi:hypothetical protein